MTKEVEVRWIDDVSEGGVNIKRLSQSMGDKRQRGSIRREKYYD